MAKKRSTKKTKAKKSSTRKKASGRSEGTRGTTGGDNWTVETGDVPPIRSIESLMALLGGAGGARTPVEEAQQIMYDAWESTPARGVTLARKALAVSPDCADAYNLLAGRTESLEEARELYQQGVDAGARAIGEEAFAEDVGHFWGLIETRPYMRAREGLAQSLWLLDERDDAIAHFIDMLRLNPGDNQGIRYVLMSCLLQVGRWDDAEKLRAAYEDDASAAWAYARALLEYGRDGDTPKARRFLARAVKSNAHVPAYLTGRKKPPRSLPEHYGFGDPNEAAIFVFEHGIAWREVPGAIAWMKANT